MVPGRPGRPAGRPGARRRLGVKCPPPGSARGTPRLRAAFLASDNLLQGRALLFDDSPRVCSGFPGVRCWPGRAAADPGSCASAERQRQRRPSRRRPSRRRPSRRWRRQRRPSGPRKLCRRRALANRLHQEQRWIWEPRALPFETVNTETAGRLAVRTKPRGLRRRGGGATCPGGQADTGMSRACSSGSRATGRKAC